MTDIDPASLEAIKLLKSKGITLEEVCELISVKTDEKLNVNKAISEGKISELDFNLND